MAAGRLRPRPRPSVWRYGYGLHWAGLDAVSDLAPAGDPTSAEAAPSAAERTGRPVARVRPVVRVRLAGTVPAPPPVPLGPGYGTWTFLDGRLVAIDRHAGTATFHGPPPAPDMLAHPYLAPVATAFHRWAGRESFHAGAFVADDRAWVLLGGRTAGKSSLLAALAARGVPVLADDVVMVDDAGVYAGPRCVDLRQPVPGLALETRPVRDGTRLRISLPPITDPCPLGGWLFLDWHEAPALDRVPVPRLRPVGATDLLGRLAARRTWPGLFSDPAVLLALAAHPAWELVRPRDWATLDQTCHVLERLASDSATSATACASTTATATTSTAIAAAGSGARP